MKLRTIIKITPFQHKNNPDSNQIKLHHLIILFTKDQLTTNRYINNGFLIEYLYYRAERFTLQY